MVRRKSVRHPQREASSHKLIRPDGQARKERARTFRGEKRPRPSERIRNPEPQCRSSTELDRTIAVLNLVDHDHTRHTLSDSRNDKWGHTIVILQTDQEPATMSIAHGVRDRRAKSLDDCTFQPGLSDGRASCEYSGETLRWVSNCGTDCGLWEVGSKICQRYLGSQE